MPLNVDTGRGGGKAFYDFQISSLGRGADDFTISSHLHFPNPPSSPRVFGETMFGSCAQVTAAKSGLDVASTKPLPVTSPKPSPRGPSKMMGAGR